MDSRLDREGQEKEVIEKQWVVRYKHRTAHCFLFSVHCPLTTVHSVCILLSADHGDFGYFFELIKEGRTNAYLCFSFYLL